MNIVLLDGIVVRVVEQDDAVMVEVGGITRAKEVIGARIDRDTGIAVAIADVVFDFIAVAAI